MFANEANHRDVIRRVKETRGILLNEYVVAPFDPNDPASLAGFLANNFAMHAQMNRVLGLASNVLNTLNWQDQNALAEWVFEHYTEHQAASQILEIG